jgi:hypothetical protein
MADINLTFDSGVRDLELSDGKDRAVVVRFNPYDVMFIATVMDAAEKLDAVQQELTAFNGETWREIYEACVDADKKMREILDGIFNVPICEALFSGQSVHAIGNGFPAWVNLLVAILDNMDAGLEAEKTKAQTRIRKYSGKYKK